MSDSIKLSPKYGLNPTIPVCFWCGKEKGDIALMGRVRKKETRPTTYGGTSTRVVDDDVQMPMNVCLDTVPCEECAEKWALGIPVIRASSMRDDKCMEVISADGSKVYLDGRYSVVTTEAFARIFGQERSKGQPIYLEDKAYDKLFKDVPETDVTKTED